MSLPRSARVGPTDVAIAIVRCGSGTFSGPPKEGGFLFRLTFGLRNIDGD
jgi:hypothetical protein